MSQDNKLTYIIIILIILVVIMYHFNYKKHLHNNEPFENKVNNPVIVGEVNNLPIGNPILPINNQNNNNSNGEIIMTRVNGDFSSNLVVEEEEDEEDEEEVSQNVIQTNSTMEPNSERLNIDNVSRGPTLLPQGYIVIKFTHIKIIKGFLIKGLKNYRIDINQDGSDVFKPLFTGEIRDNNLDKLNVFSKSSINQTNGVDSSNDISVKSLKITNLDKNNSDEIKMELLEQVNNNLDKNTSSNQINDVKILNPENQIINKYNNEVANLELRLNKPEIVSGISLKTNIPHFKVMINANVSFPKQGMFEGGKNGITLRNYYFDIPVKTDRLRIVPLINPSLFNDDDDKVFNIKEVNVYKSSKKANKNINAGLNDMFEGFENENTSSMSNQEVLLKDLQSSIDIQKACAALENQEKINSEETKLQQFKIYNLKLQKQKEEFERLNATINQLREKRAKQMKKQDMINVAKYQGLRGQEIKIKDAINKRLEKQNKFDINLNLIKKGTN